MLDQYSVSENGYFFTDVSAPTVPEVSYGDLSPPIAIRFTVPEPGVTTVEIDDWYMPTFVRCEQNCVDDLLLCAVYVFATDHDVAVDDWYPFRHEVNDTFEVGTVVSYEDCDMILTDFVYDGSNKLLSYIETNKSTFVMVRYDFTRSAGPGLDAIGSNEDYQTFAFTGQVILLSDDVANVDIENYEILETII
jgi:hypothetical protein